MAAVADSGEDSAFPPAVVEEIPTGGVLEEQPLLEYAAQQAQLLKETIDEATSSAVRIARSRLSEIRSTSSAHLHQSLEILGSIKESVEDRYVAYEDAAFGKLKEGVLVAASHPKLSCGVAAGVGIFTLKRPRHFLFRNPLRFFASKESVLSSAEAKANLLKQSIELMKLERKKLEDRALMAKEQMEWGQRELRKACNQIQGIVRSVHEIKTRAKGLKVIFRELPGSEASQLRSKVSSFPSQVKHERKALGRKISRINNYGILT